MTLKEIKMETILSTALIQPKKLNDRKGFRENQWNPKGALVLCKNQL